MDEFRDRIEFQRRFPDERRAPRIECMHAGRTGSGVRRAATPTAGSFRARRSLGNAPVATGSDRRHGDARLEVATPSGSERRI